MARPQRLERPTRQRVIEAALKTLREVGYGGATARAIARTGGFAPGVIYYHFDDLEDLMLAALEHTSSRRLESYRVGLQGIKNATDLVERLSSLYEEDLAGGHIAAVQEMIAGASSSPEFGREIVKRLDPWIDYTAGVIEELLAGSAFATLLPARDIAFVMIALYMGIETMTHLDADRSRSEALFASARRLAPMADMLLLNSGKQS